MASETVRVAVAVISRNNKILIARRPQHLHQGGLWEFPGGKLELHESVTDTLVRELSEELDIEATHYTPLIRIHHDYGDKKVLLDAWRVTAFEGEPHGHEGQETRWVESGELPKYDFPLANKAILKALALPSRCLITPEPVDASSFLKALKNSLLAGVRLVQLRAKSLDEERYLSLAQQVEALCHEFSATLILNTSVEVFQKTNADGLHLSAEHLMALSTRPVEKRVLLSAACHTIEEVAQANRLELDLIFVSPVEKTLSHPGTAPIGWKGLYELSDPANMPVYALGGMESNDVDKARRYGAQGIAAIRALWHEA